MSILNTIFSSQRPPSSQLHIDTESDNYGIGENLTFFSTATDNIAIGENALNDTTTDALRNIAIGTGALTALTAGDQNIAIGVSALSNADGTETHNIAIGFDSLKLLNHDAGLRNIAIGSCALDGVQEVALSDCIAIGYEALSGLATQDNTVAIGRSALKALEGGGGNCAIGYQAGLLLTSGANNTILGNYAFDAADGGEGHNVALGHAAMGAVDHDNSDYNVCIGYNAGLGGDAAMDNCVAIGNLALFGSADNAQSGTIAIGSSALTALTTGDYNVAVGFETLKSNQDGDHNIAIGHQTLVNLTSSTRNTAIGHQAMGNSDATAVGLADCVAIGWQAFLGDATDGTGTTTGANGTVAIGKSALTALTSGAANTAVGYNAMIDNTTGIQNTVLGYNAMSQSGGSDGLQAGKNSDDNVFIGYVSGGGLWANAESEFNVAVGGSTLAGAMNGADNNTAVGFEALMVVTTGTTNTSVGAGSGKAIADGIGNTAVGFQAGDSTTTGDYNTCIGYGADPGGSGYSYTTLIGHNATEDQSFQTVIGEQSVFKFVSRTVTCTLGGTDENDPAHATAICKIPRYAVITKAIAIVSVLSSESNHSLKLCLSTSSSGTDGTVLANVQDLIGTGATSWAGSQASGENVAIDVKASGVLHVAHAAAAEGDDEALSTLDLSGSDHYVYLAFNDDAYSGSSGGEDNPSTAPEVKVLIEYAGTQT